ncbi:MAG: RNase adapter RapZ [Armatimonadota bacterium]|nr:RNase adapter RapZ [Armatimonadota bacterium]
MQLVIITGLSGAGKAQAAKVFEDMAYTVVDNLPPVLLPELVEKCLAMGDQPPANRLAVVIDARSGAFFAGLEPALALVRRQGVRPLLLFLDASDAVLVQRFKETRRKHPLFEENGGILGSIRAERALLESVKEAADKVVDTSDFDAHELRSSLITDFSEERDKNQGLIVTVTSFGFKYGLPLDADLIFDVRFLVNPHYVDDLRPFDGRDQRVEEYVMRDPDSGLFLEKLYDLIEWSLPQYIEEGKAYLTIAIGCTGGRHRSVVVSEKLGNRLRGLGYRALVQHRDVSK